MIFVLFFYLPYICIITVSWHGFYNKDNKLTWMNPLVIHLVDGGSVLDKTDDLSGAHWLDGTVILTNLDLRPSGVGREPLPCNRDPGSSHYWPTEGIHIGDAELDIQGRNIVGTGIKNYSLYMHIDQLIWLFYFLLKLTLTLITFNFRYLLVFSKIPF